MLDEVPSHFSQWAPGQDGARSCEDSDAHVQKVQLEVMRANIHVTHLWLQSIILDQIEALQRSDAAASTPVPDSMVSWTEREDICRPLLHVLHSVSDTSLEPNGHHLVSAFETSETRERWRYHKTSPFRLIRADLFLSCFLQTYETRDVAVSLLTCPFDQQDKVSVRASQHLRQFTATFIAFRWEREDKHHEFAKLGRHRSPSPLNVQNQNTTAHGGYSQKE